MTKIDISRFVHKHFQGVYLITIAAGIIGSLSGMNYLTNIVETNETNPFKQHEFKKKAKKQHENLYKQVFGDGGFADQNKDRAIDFGEKVCAYRLMGHNEMFIDGAMFYEKGSFPILKPTTSELEQADKKYQTTEYEHRLKQDITFRRIIDKRGQKQ